MANGDTNKFPILTRSIDTMETTAEPSAARAPLARSIDQAMREVLGWRPKKDDAKGFLAALNRSFRCEEVNGLTRCDWTPRNGATSVQADMGEITGAQASLYAQAKIAVEQALTLLDGLEPLRVDADEEAMEATRSIVRSHLGELLEELGTEGGPRTMRVDGLLEDLVDYDTASAPQVSFAADLVSADFDADDSQDHLVRQLQRRFGLTKDVVNTIAEERTLTDFLLFSDHIDNVAASWHRNRTSFGHDAAQGYLGTELVRLSWQLAVIAESVQELYFLLDSVFVGAAERQTLELTLDVRGKQQILTIAEALEWVREFAAEEGPRLLEDAGKDGVRRFQKTLQDLSDLIEAMTTYAATRRNPTDGFHSPRVVAGFKELETHIATAQDSADRILGNTDPIADRRAGRAERRKLPGRSGSGRPGSEDPTNSGFTDEQASLLQEILNRVGVGGRRDDWGHTGAEGESHTPLGAPAPATADTDTKPNADADVKVKADADAKAKAKPKTKASAKAKTDPKAKGKRRRQGPRP